MPSSKYTYETLCPVVEASLSYAEVLRRLGVKQAGASQSNIKRLVQKFRISTEHFLGQSRNQGNSHRGGPRKATAEEILVLRDTLAHHEKAVRLRRAMIDIGISYCCAICGMEPVWNGKPLRLTVDHINGSRNDNRRENLRFLCHNCHSQTPTFGKSKGLTDVTTDKRRAVYYRQKRKQFSVKEEKIVNSRPENLNGDVAELVDAHV
ncbi:MAG: HNH endonuclease signature motif containing protein [Pyrinomonadaceae bacterium]